MKGGYIVAVGSACIDEYYRAKEWPDEGDKGLVTAMEAQVGGMIANAACVFACYGNPVFLLDSMNNGPVSQKLKENLERYHLDTSRIIPDDTLPDAKCLIVVTPSERTILVVDRGDFRRALSRETKELLCGAACVYTTLTEFRRFPEPESLARELKAKGVRLVFDLEPSTFQNAEDPLFRLANILFFNETGLRKYCAEREESVCINELLHAGVEIVVTTLGADGCDCRTARETVRIPGIPVPVVDTTGAGDTFNSSFTFCILEGESLEYAARFANAAATHSVTVLGPKGGVTSRASVASFMKEYYR
ncbi:MAG: carbohydrate kinase family protein [Eubacteriales bacterium]|nr:carbohydrate kinase family protein [Eubacteriales bacterium]